MDQIQIAVGPGELLDRLSILSIKASFATCPAVRQTIEDQIAMLTIQRGAISGYPEIDGLEQELASVNRQLWMIEDRLREMEGNQDFGQAFIELARSVYWLNDRRASIRGKVDTLCESEITDYKIYSADGDLHCELEDDSVGEWPNFTRLANQHVADDR